MRYTAKLGIAMTLFTLAFASCDLFDSPPDDATAIQTIPPGSYSYLSEWTYGSMDVDDDELWYALDATGGSAPTYIHWQDSDYHAGSGADPSFTLDIWVTIYAEDMEELWSSDHGWSDHYDAIEGANSGYAAAGGGIYYIKITKYRSTSAGNFYICAVQEP